MLLLPSVGSHALKAKQRENVQCRIITRIQFQKDYYPAHISKSFQWCDPLTGAIVCVCEISVSSWPSAAVATSDWSFHVNWKPSTTVGSSACWDILQRNVVSKVPLTCSKCADSLSGRSTTFLPDRRRSDTNKSTKPLKNRRSVLWLGLCDTSL